MGNFLATKPSRTPLLSVILPYFNAENTISFAIESLLKQTFTNFQVLAVDNNSVDSSASIIKQYAEQDSRIVMISEKKQGVVYAHNAGAIHANTEFLARMDADDVALPSKFQRQIDFLLKNPDKDAVATCVEYEPYASNNEGFERFVNWSNSVCSFEDIYLSQFIELPIVHPTAMWRREVGERFGNCLSGSFPEDYEMWLRWLRNGVRVEKLPEKLLVWKDSAARLTRTDPIYSVDSFFKIKTKYLAKWLENNNSFHPKCYVWAGGRKNFQRAKLLHEYGIEIIGNIDVIERDRTIYYKNIPSAKDCFIVSYVNNWGARKKIRSFLTERGFIEGQNFICAS